MINIDARVQKTLEETNLDRYTATSQILESKAVTKAQTQEYAAAMGIEVIPAWTKRETIAMVQQRLRDEQAPASTKPAKVEPTPQVEMAEEPTPAPLAGSLLLAVEEVAEGDSYFTIKILEVQAAKKWVYFRSDAGWFFQALRGTPVQVVR